MESSFTDSEKRYVLAEMIKVSQMDVATLVDFAKHHALRPDWLNMQLPGGRNLNQCIHAAEVMFNTQLQPPSFASKRKSFSDDSEQLPKRKHVPSPTTDHLAYPNTARGIYLTHPANSAQPVNIQPRPALNGYTASPATSSPSVSATTPSSATASGRKRGRPSKAEKEAWARQNAPPQPASYAPISPVPIAPLPPATPSTYSPSSGPPAYILSSVNSASESKPKKRGRTSAGEKTPQGDQQKRSGSKNGSASEPKSAEESGEPQSAAVSHNEYLEWREHPRQPNVRPPGPVLLEPPVHSHSATMQHPARSPYISLAAGTAPRDSVHLAIEHAKKEEHPQVANQA